MKQTIKRNSIINKAGTIDLGLLCESIMGQFPIKSYKTRLYIGDERLGYYQYVKDETFFIYSLVDNDCRQSLNTYQIKEVSTRLKHMPETVVSDSWFNEDPYLINLSNGIFDIRTKNMSSHSLEHGFLNCVGFNYIENADIESAQAFKGFIDTSLQSDEIKVKRLLEIIGYVISNNFSAKKAFIFHGAPHSGKTVILNLIKQVFGEEYTSALSLNQLGERFSSGRLAISRLNINGDIDSQRLKDIATFKKLIGGDSVKGEDKFEKIFEFIPRVHFLFGCNAMPGVKDINGIQAFIDRICILDFPVSIKQENWDMELVEKLYAERDVIFSLALDALHDLEARNMVFSEDEGSLAVFEEYKNHLDPISAFIRDECVVEEVAQCYCGDFVKTLRNWCLDCGYEIKYTDNQIMQAVTTNHHITKCKGRINRGRPMAKFVGLRLKDEEKA